MNKTAFEYCFNNLDDNHPKSENIPGLSIELMNHQKTAIYHAEILENNDGFIINNPPSSGQSYFYRNEDESNQERDIFCNFGILACKVGSGKSFVALGLILKKKLLNFERTVGEEKNSLCFSFKKITTINRTVSTNIILVPHNLFNQWKQYIVNFTNLDTIYISKRKELDEYVNHMINYDRIIYGSDEDKIEKSIEMLKIFATDKVYLISSNFWNLFAHNWELKVKKKISRLFIDEVHSLSLPASVKLRSNFTWFITSSYTDMREHRNKGFVYDTITSYYGVDKTIRDYIVIKNKDEYVDSSLQLPKPIFDVIRCRPSVILNIFEGIINQDVKNMLLAEDITGVVGYLGLETVGESDIIKVLCANMEKDLENAKIQLQAKTIMHYASEQTKTEAIQRAKEKIQSIEEKIENVRQRIIDNNMDPIMHMDITSPVITNCCNNKFDLESITSYYEFQVKKGQVNCPLCRKKLDIGKLIYVGNIEKKNPEKIENSEYNFNEHSKIDNLKYILQNKIEPHKRILIFSEHEGNFDTISEAFHESGRTNLSPVKGSINHISSLIEKYNSGDIPNLFLNARYCGSGLNMEKTDIIIIMHSMTKENIKQIIGRGNRIGRTGALQVYFLYTEMEGNPTI